jgi:hypothetical protein
MPRKRGSLDVPDPMGLHGLLQGYIYLLKYLHSYARWKFIHGYKYGGSLSLVSLPTYSLVQRCGRTGRYETKREQRDGREKEEKKEEQGQKNSNKG